MGFIGGLFGSKKLVDGATDLITDKAPKALDKMFLTDEERLDFRQKNGENFLEMTRIFMSENSSFALARRVLAFIAFGYYFPMLIACAVMFVWSVFVPPTSTEQNMLDLHWRLIGAAGYLKQLALDQLPIIVTIAMFYYGPGVLDRLKR